jgi:hypothetical protein
MDVNCVVSDYNQVEQIKKHLWVGQAFVFLSRKAFAGRSFAWLRHLEVAGSTADDMMVMPLLGARAVELPGVSLGPVKLEALNLRSLTSDKMVYQARKETVNILLFDAHNAGKRVDLDLRHNGQRYRTLTEQLDAAGAGHLLLHDLPPGEYDLSFNAEDNPDYFCRFSVAEYKLAPLVSSIIDQQYDPDSRKLALTANIESFGVPVNGRVKVEVYDGSRRDYSMEADCIDGNLSIHVAISGAGPHQLVFQVASDPSKTASAALIGTRQQERQETLFNPLGTEVVASLLPRANSQQIRGLHFSNGASRSTPLALVETKNGRMVLEARAAMQNLNLIAVDPKHPAPGEQAIVPTDANHPGLHDARYVRAKKLFNEGQIAAALAVFEECWQQDAPLHPNYPYYIACCHARLGNAEQAKQYLRQAIACGWADYDHLASDSDLRALHGDPEFQVLAAGGLRAATYGEVAPGQRVEIELFAPVCLMAAAAIVDGEPWEGWSAAVVPTATQCQIDCADSYEPGVQAELRFERLPENGRLFVVVKDARLISQDTVSARLASRMKKYVDGASKRLAVGRTTRKGSLLSQLAVPAASGWGSAGSVAVYGSAAGALRPAPQSPAVMAMAMQQVFGDAEMQSRPRREHALNHAAFPAPGSRWYEDDSLLSLENTGVRGRSIADVAESSGSAIETQRQPEVIFAGFVAYSGSSSAVLHLQLPDTFADYLVEAFVTTGDDWCSAARTFKADKSQFVQLSLPLYACAEDRSAGVLYVRSRHSDACVELRRDGQPVEINGNGRECEGIISAGEQTRALSFIALPGTYEAVLTAKSGEQLSRQCRTVSLPGKLQHHVTSLRVLQPGETLALEEIAGAQRLSIAPGLQKSFDVMVNATADYEHCCCEQTAAKIIAGCAMYLLSGDGEGGNKRRRLGESVIIAGIKREQTMWVKGSGLMSYPGFPVNPHLGLAAARHLRSLSSMTQTGSGFQLSKELQAAIKTALEIAADAGKDEQWPPSEVRDCWQAYQTFAFHPETSARQEALRFVRQQLPELKRDEPGRAEPRDGIWHFMGESVHKRVERSFAAATLLRSGEPSSLADAMMLANLVIADVNEQGRLYSTVDSAAAIALVSELKSKFVTAGSKLEVNGRTTTVAEAATSTELIGKLRVLERLVTAKIERVVEEDWSAFRSQADVRVQLMNNGSVVSSIKAGGQLELCVEIADGYNTGDLLWVCLPEALSRIYGGAQVKLFSVDFEGKNELRIPLAVTCSAGRSATLAVCLRNMFDEERAGNPGLIVLPLLA